MKRFAKIISMVAVLAALLSVSIFAADFDHCADALKDLGLFQGTTKGYELDRAPNRAEAGVMLVRLLGKEDDAKKLTYTAPFTDVQDWAKPYVQYLYDNGLTKGKTATAFGYGDQCTAQQYATFLLRALGYSDTNGDFTYAKAMDFATEKGVVDAVNCDASNFLRDDVVAMSYTALATAPKSGEADLLTKLVKDGAVKDAKGYDKTFALYRDYAKAASASNEVSKQHLTTDMTIASKMDGMNYISGTMKMDMLMDMDTAKMDQSKMAITSVMDLKMDDAIVKASGLSASDAAIKTTAKYYYTNGYFYMDMDGTKTKTPLSFEDAMAQIQSANMPTNEPIALLKSISTTTSGSTKTYAIEYAPAAFGNLMDLASSLAGAQSGMTTNVKISKMAISSTVQNNQLQSMTADIGMSVGMTVNAQTVNMDMSMNVKSTVVASGSSVTVTLPTDLNTYTLAAG